MSNTRRTSRGKWIRKVLECPDCPSTITTMGDYVDVRHESTCPMARKMLTNNDIPIRYRGAWV